MLVWWTLLWQPKRTPWASLLTVKLHLFHISVRSYYVLIINADIVSYVHDMAWNAVFTMKGNVSIDLSTFIGKGFQYLQMSKKPYITYCWLFWDLGPLVKLNQHESCNPTICRVNTAKICHYGFWTAAQPPGQTQLRSTLIFDRDVLFGRCAKVHAFLIFCTIVVVILHLNTWLEDLKSFWNQSCFKQRKIPQLKVSH